MRDLPVYGAVLAAAYVLKRHSAAAGADELRFILEPTGRLVAALTGSPFPFESGVGAVSTELRFIVAPECAGVNFLIVALVSLVFALLPLRRRSIPATFGFVTACVGVAYAATVLANAVRIVATLHLAPDAFGHRALGIAVYLGALLLLHGAARRLPVRPCSARPSPGT